MTAAIRWTITHVTRAFGVIAVVPGINVCNCGKRRFPLKA
jgi:hypothetical protein